MHYISLLVAFHECIHTLMRIHRPCEWTECRRSWSGRSNMFSRTAVAATKPPSIPQRKPNHPFLVSMRRLPGRPFFLLSGVFRMIPFFYCLHYESRRAAPKWRFVRDTRLCLPL